MNKTQSKEQLVASMQKLIKHISQNRKNQEQIFMSLSVNDFRKIISNLCDTNQRLRKISLELLCELILNDQSLKKQFCDIMSIAYIPGKIILNTNLLSSSYLNLKHLLALLKNHLTQQQQRTNLWYIDLKHPHQIIPIRNNQELEYIDPMSNLIGFIIHPQNIKPQKSNIKQIKNYNFSNLQNIQNQYKNQYHHKVKYSLYERTHIHTKLKSENNHQNNNSITSRTNYAEVNQLYSSCRDKKGTIHIDSEIKQNPKYGKIISHSKHQPANSALAGSTLQTLQKPEYYEQRMNDKDYKYLMLRGIKYPERKPFKYNFNNPSNY